MVISTNISNNFCILNVTCYCKYFKLILEHNVEDEYNVSIHQLWALYGPCSRTGVTCVALDLPRQHVTPVREQGP